MDGLWQPRHAILAAALYLKDHGAPGDLRRALYRYNNDWDYVDRVLALAARYAAAVPADGVAARALALARTQLGVPYRWGGGEPGRGFDCSGLTQWAFAEAGHRLPRTAQQQFFATQRVARADLRPGDLVFFAGDPGPAGSMGHARRGLRRRRPDGRRAGPGRGRARGAGLVGQLRRRRPGRRRPASRPPLS